MSNAIYNYQLRLYNTLINELDLSGLQAHIIGQVYRGGFLVSRQLALNPIATITRERALLHSKIDTKLLCCVKEIHVELLVA